MSRSASRAVAAAGLAVAASLVLVACGGGGSSGSADFRKDVSGSMNAWAFDSADDVGKARLGYADRRLKSAGVAITLDKTAFDAQKFATRTASGRVPDVIQMNSQYVTTYAAQGLIMPLDACYSLYDVDPTTYFYPQVAADVTYQKKTWGVPQFYQPPAILLNTRVMQQAGVTADDFDVSKQDRLLTAITKLTSFQGSNPTRVGFDPQGVSQAGLWMLSFGGRLVDSSGKPALDDPKNAEAIRFLKRIYDAQGGYANANSFIDSFDVFGDGNQFVKDQVGAEIYPQWYVNVLAGYSDRVKLTAVPFRDQQGEPFTVASGQAFVIPTKAKNPSAACKWMIDVTSASSWDAAAKARQATLAETPGSINTGLFTGVKSVDKSIRTTYTGSSGDRGFEEAITTYYEVASEGKSFGSSPAGQQVASELASAVTSALLGEKSATAALAGAQKAAMSAYTRIAG
ncbi:MAG: extracellular solute-binding protein [Micrococcales bacterium]|nr:extracellular solute-binding protein [Micrococcales bacterium]